MILLKIFLNLFEAIKLSYSFFSLHLEKKIAKILKENNLVISIAESCTGGLISSRLTDVSGSSNFIKENLITYANEAKAKNLKVEKKSIETHGVVSEEVASQMAEGLLKEESCDIALSTTGIAGPTGGSKEKPVGLVYMGITNSINNQVNKESINPLLDRRIIKYKFSQKALEHLYEFLKQNYL